MQMSFGYVFWLRFLSQGQGLIGHCSDHRQLYMAANDSMELVIFTSSSHKAVKMTCSRKVVCKQGVIPYFVARGGLWEQRSEA